MAAIISAFGQVLLKYTMLRHGEITFTAGGLASLLLQPLLLFALVLYGCSLLMWLQVLSRVPLSTAYPILAITYIVVPILSVVFFGEQIHSPQIIGMLLILAGVAIIGSNYQ